jgi:hypothetical protein
MKLDPDYKKARSDAKLKTLPAERQAEIFEKLNLPGDQGGGYRNTLKWLLDDGFKTSLRVISQFFAWYRLRQRLATNYRTVSQVLEDIKREEPDLTDTQLERAGQRFFAALAIEQERLHRETEKTDAEVVAQFQRWATKPDVRDWISRRLVGVDVRRRSHGQDNQRPANRIQNLPVRLIKLN